MTRRAARGKYPREEISTHATASIKDHTPLNIKNRAHGRQQNDPINKPWFQFLEIPKDHTTLKRKETPSVLPDQVVWGEEKPTFALP
jgi:hypothetical protein